MILPNFIDPNLQNVIDGIGDNRRCTIYLDEGKYTILVDRFSTTNRVIIFIGEEYGEHKVSLEWFSTHCAGFISAGSIGRSCSPSQAVDYLIQQSAPLDNELRDWLLWNQLC